MLDQQTCGGGNAKHTSEVSHLILTASLKVGNLGFSPGSSGSAGFGLVALAQPPPSSAVENSFRNLQTIN